MPRDAVSRTANVERTGRHKWESVVGLTVGKSNGLHCKKKYIGCQKLSIMGDQLMETLKHLNTILQ